MFSELAVVWRDGRRKRRPLSPNSRFAPLLETQTSRAGGFGTWESTRDAGLSGWVLSGSSWRTGGEVSIEWKRGSSILPPLLVKAATYLQKRPTPSASWENRVWGAWSED